MSIKLVSNPEHPHGIADDIESFIWLLLWIAAKYGPHSYGGSSLRDFLTHFDYNPQLSLAGAKRDLALQGSGAVLELLLETPGLEKLLSLLMTSVNHLHLGPQRLSRLDFSQSQIDEVTGRLQTHKWMMETINKALEDQKWRETLDPSRNHKLPIPEGSTARATKFTSFLMSERSSTGSKRAHESESVGSSSSKKQKTIDE